MVGRRLFRVFAVAAAAIATLAAAPSSSGSIAQPTVVSQVPSATTPHAIDDGVVGNAAVHTFTQVGEVMYAGGHFHSVQEPRRTTTMVRDNLFSFDVVTGQPTGWAPLVNGEVWRTLYIEPYFYVGGSFTSADGVPERLVRYNLASGTPRSTPPGIPQGSRTRERPRVRRWTTPRCRSFNKRLVALDPVTGLDTGYLNLPITGSVKVNAAGPVEVYRFAVSPDGASLVGIGNFTTVGTASRARAFMLDLGRPRQRSTPWYYQPLIKTAPPAACGTTCATSTSAPTGPTS